ncbi:MAG: hypothetical protein V1729_04190 [Candidatus Woesearchaeota archaeon]
MYKDEHGFMDYLARYDSGEVEQQEGAYHRFLLRLAEHPSDALRVFKAHKDVRAGNLEKFVAEEIVFD